MINLQITESDCVSCGLPCLHESCPHYKVTRYYCDMCGDESTLYELDGQELCIDCVEKVLPMVEGSDVYD